MSDKEARKIKGKLVKIVNVSNMSDDEMLDVILGSSDKTSEEDNKKTNERWR